MTVHVSARSISALPLPSVSLLALPADALAQTVVAPQKTVPTFAKRLDRLEAESVGNRLDVHVPGAVLAIVRGEEVIFQVERVEVGVRLARDTFTLQPSAASGQGR
jgi:hypothetical protein